MNSIWFYSWVRCKQKSPKFFFQKGTLLTCVLLNFWARQLTDGWNKFQSKIFSGWCFNASDGRKNKKSIHQETHGIQENRINYQPKTESTNLKIIQENTSKLFWIHVLLTPAVFFEHFGVPHHLALPNQLRVFSTWPGNASKQLRISAPGHLAWTCMSQRLKGTLRGEALAFFFDPSNKNSWNLKTVQLEM